MGTLAFHEISSGGKHLSKEVHSVESHVEADEPVSFPRMGSKVTVGSAMEAMVFAVITIYGFSCASKKNRKFFNDFTNYGFTTPRIRVSENELETKL